MRKAIWIIALMLCGCGKPAAIKLVDMCPTTPAVQELRNECRKAQMHLQIIYWSDGYHVRIWPYALGNDGDEPWAYTGVNEDLDEAIRDAHDSWSEGRRTIYNANEPEKQLCFD